MRDNRRQQINNQPLMGVAKAGKDTAVKATAAPAVNGAFCLCVDHDGGGKLAPMAGQWETTDSSRSSSQEKIN
jgi:hypothetical protein